MARIIKKAAASLTPALLAYTRKTPLRNYSTSSSIFINPKLKNKSTSLIYRQDLPLNLQLFSSTAENNKGPSVCPEVKAEDLLHKVVQTPSDFPFKIEDKPGKPTVTLTREYWGDDIKVMFTCLQVVPLLSKKRGD
ncbi:uncharacterized protein LOC113324905 [Papaver somniferum]|uniref:uncharacterized protein LOC113324905 n=1 Tax=Papaver somniferum TaxID=3469 RepID=UPI000E6FF51B|nr:uncharacterized protein LOC113324905 [Papaver somniferum]